MDKREMAGNDYGNRFNHLMLKWAGIGLFYFLCLLPTAGNARSYSADDSIRVMKIVREIKDSIDVDRRRSLEKTLEVIKISREAGFKYGIAKGLNLEAFIYMLLTKYDSSIMFSQEAIKIAREHDFNTLEINARVNLGIVYEFLGDYNRSMESYQTGLKLLRSGTDTNAMIGLYVNFGELMSTMGDFKNAEKYYRIYLKYSVDNHQPINIAKAYIKMSNVCHEQKQYADERAYLMGCIRVCDSIGLRGSVLGAACQGLGIFYSREGVYDSAIHYYTRALSLNEENQDEYNQAAVLCNLGNMYYVHLHKVKEAETYYKRSRALAVKCSSLRTIIDCDNALSDLYMKNGDYKNAYDHRTSQLELHDSLYNKQKVAAIEALNNRFNTMELENKNASLLKEADMQKLRLQHKDVLLYGGGAFAVLLLASGLLLFRHNRLRTNQQLIQLEQKQLLAQINPHFIFNCLNSVQQFVVQNDIENANKYLADFAMLMRQTLDNSKDGTIPLYRELEYLENYLSLESMRFEDIFSYKITWAEDVEINTIEIPSMIIQPYVENAINHGLTNLEDKAGILNVNFYKKDGVLFCEVDDNGIGMENSKKLKEQMFIKHMSKGMEMTRLRLVLVSKMNGVDYQVSVINKTNSNGLSEGTTIVIKFPLKT